MLAKCKTISFFSLLALLCLPVFVSGNGKITQEVSGDSGPEKKSVSAWYYGLNLGVYYAHKSTANYYNGSGEHNLQEALFRTYNYERIVNQLESIIESFQIGELPLNMKYNPAIQVGFFGGLNLGKGFSINGEFNYTKLSIPDRFTIITDKFTSTSEPLIVLGDIFGTEERIDLRLGIQYTLQTRSYIHPFIESGINITDTKVIENKARLDGITISIREIRTDYYNIRDYGMGLGIYSAIGLRMDVSDNFALRIGGSVSFSHINLGDNAGIKPQYTGFIRIHLDEILNPSGSP